MASLSLNKKEREVQTHLNALTFRAVPHLTQHFPTLQKINADDCTRANEVLTRICTKTSPTDAQCSAAPITQDTELFDTQIKNTASQGIAWIKNAKVTFSNTLPCLVNITQDKSEGTHIIFHTDILKVPNQERTTLALFLLLYGCSSAELVGEAGQRGICGLISTIALTYIAANKPKQSFTLMADGFNYLQALGWDSMYLSVLFARVPTLFRFSDEEISSFESGIPHARSIATWRSLLLGTNALLSGVDGKTLVSDIFDQCCILDVARPTILKALIVCGAASQDGKYARLDSITTLANIERDCLTAIINDQPTPTLPVAVYEQYIKSIILRCQNYATLSGMAQSLGEKFGLSNVEISLLRDAQLVLPTRAQVGSTRGHARLTRRLSPEVRSWLVVADWFCSEPFHPIALPLIAALKDLRELSFRTHSTLIYNFHEACYGFENLSFIIGNYAAAKVLSNLDLDSASKILRRFGLLGTEQNSPFRTIFNTDYATTLKHAITDRATFHRLYDIICYFSLNERVFFGVKSELPERWLARLTDIPALFKRRFGFILALPAPKNTGTATGHPTDKIYKSAAPIESEILLSMRAAITSKSIIAPEVLDAIIDCYITIGKSTRITFCTQENAGLTSLMVIPQHILLRIKERGHLQLQQAPEESAHTLNFIANVMGPAALNEFTTEVMQGLSICPGRYMPAACRFLSSIHHLAMFHTALEYVIKDGAEASLSAFLAMSKVNQVLSTEALTIKDYEVARRLLTTQGTPVVIKKWIKTTLPPQDFDKASQGIEPALLAAAFDTAQEALAILPQGDNRLRSIVIRKVYFAHKKYEKTKPSFTDYLTGEENIPNHYVTLAIPLTASEDEIKISFRLLSSAFHPDLVVDAAEKRLATTLQSRLNAAKEVLLNEEKRIAYDTIIIGNKYERARDFFPTICWFDSDDASEIEGFKRPTTRADAPRRITRTAQSSDLKMPRAISEGPS